MKYAFLSVLLIFSSVIASAGDKQLVANISNMPFKTCVGRGTNMASEYAGQTVTVAFKSNAIQVIDSSGKRKTYFSVKTLCGTDLTDIEPVCREQMDEVNSQGNNYTYSKKCNVPMPGVPDRFVFYRLDLELILNLSEINGMKTGDGWLSCVINNDGFHGLELSGCK